MEQLDSIQYLDELRVDVEVEQTNKPNGTIIEIEKDNVSSDDVKIIWTSKQIRKLFLELRSLTAPEEVFQIASQQGFDISHDSFDMSLIFGDFPLDEYSNREIAIKPFPVLDLYDYKISGKVDANGKATFLYQNQNISSLPPEKIEIELPLDLSSGHTQPGELYIDLRVYDREPESITKIIKRGLKDPDTGEYVGKMEARKILDDYYGVGVYREQFRIRPYGEQSFDWLDLDKKRVQKPSYKVGHNQVIGFVYVRAEEISGLQEKSARDGLVENGAYFGLISSVLHAMNEIEGRRKLYRNKAFKGGRNKGYEDDIDLLFDFDSARKNISKELNKLGISVPQIHQVDIVVERILDKEKQNKLVYARKIRETLAIYQGQASLGKITHVLLHEGRKHIKYISETVPRISNWAIQLTKKENKELEVKVKDRSAKVITHTKGLSFLFKKIEPLARTRRSPNKKLKVIPELDSIFAIFSSEMQSNDIKFEIQFKNDCLFIDANEVDFITVFSNLIENSIFWLQHSKNSKKLITISIFEENNKICIEFKDNGPGFQGDNLDMMFEPGYSMKPEGTGLGLALVGEGLKRMGGAIEAKHSDDGAIFELILNGVTND
jgi:signal transduction histidine kinase